MSPPGLKLYPGLLAPAEVAQILAQPEMVQPVPENPQLFRLFGEFAGKPADPPSAWMLAWGDRLVERGVFPERPNQYRLCDWIGDLAGQFKWHTDNDRHGGRILAICLSGPRGIGFRDPSRPKKVHEIELAAGDAYLMSGKVRWGWEHRVLPRGRGRDGGQSFIVSRR